MLTNTDSEANPNNNLMMRQAGLSNWMGFFSSEKVNMLNIEQANNTAIIN